MLDAGGNALLRLAANGTVSTLASFPSRDDGRNTDAVPNSIAVGPDGAYYVGELTGVPFGVGAARVYRVVPGQEPEVVHAGFTAIIDIDFGPDGSLYVLQHATGPFLGGNGALIRITPDGTRTTIASDGLVKPTSVLVGGDGAIYVSNRGIFAGTGEVVLVTPSVAPAGPPVRVASVDVNDGSAQRSMVTSLTVTFDGVVSLDTGAFELVSGGSVVGLNPASSVVNGRTVVVVTFTGPGIIGGSLADGNYTLTIRAGRVHDALGRELDGDGNGSAGGDRVETFFRLFGDSDGDRDVDATDRTRLSSAMNSRRGMPNYVSFFDFDGGGYIDLQDAVWFNLRYGSYLNP